MGKVAEIDGLYKKERTRNAELQLQVEELQNLWKTYDDVLRTANTRNEQQERKHNIAVNSLIEKLQSALAEKKEENDHLHRQIVDLKDAKRNLENTVGHNKDHIKKLTDSLPKQKGKPVALSASQFTVGC